MQTKYGPDTVEGSEWRRQVEKILAVYNQNPTNLKSFTNTVEAILDFTTKQMSLGVSLGKGLKEAELGMVTQWESTHTEGELSG